MRDGLPDDCFATVAPFAATVSFARFDNFAVTQRTTGDRF